MRLHPPRSRDQSWKVLISAAVVALGAAWVSIPEVAQAATSCGVSDTHTICVTVPDAPLVGPATITVTNSLNDGRLIFTWVSGGVSTYLMTDFAPSPETGDYSFTWPTQKYLDGSGVLQVQHGSTSQASIDVAVTLQNGNVTDFQHAPADWTSFLPGAWTAARDPVIAAVGDGASDEPAGNDLAQSIANSPPDLFLYLGDIYDSGTFTENLNHYGRSDLDGGPGSLWGQMGTITQPTLGNHEAPNLTAWRDYFHGRPVYTSFRFGNVLLFDLASDRSSMAEGSKQYEYVKGILTSATNPPPPCIIAFFHRPALFRDTIDTKRFPMWTLLADNGGDLVLNGHVHTMIQYSPLNDQLQLPSAGQPTMVQLVDGSGGRAMSGPFTADPRVEWSEGNIPGAIHLTLNGAAGGGTPTSLSWAYEDTSGNPLHGGTRDCAGPPPAQPSITGFSPGSGPVGTSVTITGSGFTGTTDVRFNGTSVGSGNYTVNSDTQVTATVPFGATNGPITLDAPGGTATSPTSFTVTAPPVPTITGFFPTSGPVGTSVTITGSGFTGANSVTFNTLPALFVVGSDSEISATVPQGATTGPISVTTGGGTATSPTSFTVTTTVPISEVQRKHASISGVSISATLGSAPTPGDVLVAVIVVSQASNPVFITPPGWTAPFSPARGAVFWKVSDGTEQTVTVNLGAGETDKQLRVWVVELRGANTTNPFDQQGSGVFTSSVTSVTPTTAGATAQANEWAIAMVGQNGSNGGGESATNGFTLLATGYSRDTGASKVPAGSGPVSTTISWVTARPGSWIIATFRAAGG